VFPVIARIARGAATDSARQLPPAELIDANRENGALRVSPTQAVMLHCKRRFDQQASTSAVSTEVLRNGRSPSTFHFTAIPDAAGKPDPQRQARQGCALASNQTAVIRFDDTKLQRWVRERT
jgi:hypothetical protein